MAALELKRALVIGCAANVWNEVDEALKLFTPDRIYCVKLAAVHWPHKFDVFVTLHPEWAEAHKRQREALGYPMAFETVGPLAEELGKKHGHHPVDRRTSYRWPGMNSSASSGIFAAKVALEDGCDRIVLAGIPLTATPAIKQHPKWGGKPWGELSSFTRGFDYAIQHLREKVRSMSGLTKAKLGAPTLEWLGLPESVQPKDLAGLPVRDGRSCGMQGDN